MRWLWERCGQNVRSMYSNTIESESEENAATTLTNQNYFTKTGAELNYIIRDAGEAAKAMRGFDAAAEAKYLEQINDACTVLHSRRKAA